MAVGTFTGIIGGAIPLVIGGLADQFGLGVAWIGVPWRKSLDEDSVS